MERIKRKTSIDMTEGKFLSKILKFALPLMATGILQLLFNAADLIVVGQFDKNKDLGVAAIGSTSSLIHLILNLFLGLSAGAGVMMARAFGAKDKTYGEKVLHTSMIVSVIGGALITAGGGALSRTMLGWMNTPKECLELANQYLFIYFMGSIFNMVYNFGASMLRSTGDTVRPLIFLTFGGIINVIINLFAVLVLKLGVVGVAIATVTSQAFSAVCVVIVLMKKSEFVTLRLKHLKVDGKTLFELLRLGIPQGLQGMMFSLSNVIIQSTVNGFGKEVMAGNAAAANLEGFAYIVFNAVSCTAITGASQNYGAKKYERIKKVVGVCALVSIVSCVVTCGALIVFHKGLLSLYTDKIAYGYNRLKIIAGTYALCALMEILNGVLRGINYSLIPTVNTLIGTCVFRVFWVYVIFPLNPTTTTLYLSYPISWILTASVALILFLAGMKKLLRR